MFTEFLYIKVTLINNTFFHFLNLKPSQKCFGLNEMCYV